MGRPVGTGLNEHGKTVHRPGESPKGQFPQHTVNNEPNSKPKEGFQALPNPVAPKVDHGIAKLVEQKGLLLDLLRPELASVETLLPREIDRLLSINNQLQQNHNRVLQYTNMFKDVLVILIDIGTLQKSKWLY